MARQPKQKDVRIEHPSVGATYHRDEYGVYEYSTYPASSVLAGQQRRIWLGSYESEAEAREAHPEAEVTEPGYRPPYLGHLPEDDIGW